MLKSLGGIEKFITVFSCNSPAVTLYTSILNYSPSSVLLHEPKLKASGNMHPAVLVNFKQYCTNNAVPVCYQSTNDLFSWGIDSDSPATKGLKRANLEQIVHRTQGGKKTAIVLVQRAVQVHTNQKKMEDDDWSFLGGPTLVCSSTKTIIPPLNTGSVTQRPRKSFLRENEDSGQR